MKTLRILLIASLFFLGAVASSLDTPPPIRISISPKIGSAPLWVRVHLTVTPDANNRVLCVILDGPEFWSSCQEHLGLSAPITIWKDWKDVQEGAYVVVGEVQRVGGGVEVARTPLCVLGPNTGIATCFPD